MAFFIERINSVALNNESFSSDFSAWLANTVDTLNESISEIQNALNRYDNGLIAPSYTTAEITAFAPNADNGTLWYDTDTDELKAKVNNVVVVIA